MAQHLVRRSLATGSPRAVGVPAIRAVIATGVVGHGTLAARRRMRRRGLVAAGPPARANLIDPTTGRRAESPSAPAAAAAAPARSDGGELQTQPVGLDAIGRASCRESV